MYRSSRLAYYDAILLAIAGSCLAGVGFAVVGEWPVLTGLAAGCAVATVFVYMGLFHNPPLPETNPRVRMATVGWHFFVLGVTLLAGP